MNGDLIAALILAGFATVLVLAERQQHRREVSVRSGFPADRCNRERWGR